MGSQKPRNSTRAVRAHSRQPSRRLPAAVHEQIERQRGRLYQASALLAALHLAALYAEQPREVDAGSLAEIARSLIDQANDGLDSVALGRATCPHGGA